jgi:hypothetical protein
VTKYWVRNEASSEVLRDLQAAGSYVPYGVGLEESSRALISAAPFDALAYNGMQINGAMEISQESGAGLITGIANNGYIVDGVQVSWNGTMVANAQQVTDAPPGFKNSVKVTITTAEAVLGGFHNFCVQMPIEGYRVSRLAFGTASAQPVAIAFWVKAHRPGAYSGALRNSAANRSCPFGFTVNAADTWEFKTATVPGDTGGTWLTTTGIGLYVIFAMAADVALTGTAGAWAATNLLGVTGTTNGVAATSDVFQVSGLIVLPGIELPQQARLPLIMRPFDQELRPCLRQLEIPTLTASQYNAAAGTEGPWQTWIEPKRVPPTCTPSGTSGGPISSANAGNISTLGWRLTFVYTGAGVAFVSGWTLKADARL